MTKPITNNEVHAYLVNAFGSHEWVYRTHLPIVWRGNTADEYIYIFTEKTDILIVYVTHDGFKAFREKDFEGVSKALKIIFKEKGIEA